MINTVVYSTVLKGFAVSKRIDKVLAVYKELVQAELLPLRNGKNLFHCAIEEVTLSEACTIETHMYHMRGGPSFRLGLFYWMNVLTNPVGLLIKHLTSFGRQFL